MRNELLSRRDALIIAKAFERAHNAIDSAIGTSAALVAQLLDVRSRHVSGVAGQPELTQMLDGLCALSAARGQVIGAHHGAASLGREIGLETRAEGGFGHKPPLPTIEAEMEDTRRVA